MINCILGPEQDEYMLRLVSERVGAELDGRVSVKEIIKIIIYLGYLYKKMNTPFLYQK